MTFLNIYILVSTVGIDFNSETTWYKLHGMYSFKHFLTPLPLKSSLIKVKTLFYIFILLMFLF